MYRKEKIITALLEEYDMQSADDIQDALKELFGGTIQNMMEAELDSHLGYEPYERTSNTNSWSGHKSKTIRSKDWERSEYVANISSTTSDVWKTKSPLKGVDVMKDSISKILFILNGKKGIVEVYYEANNSVSKSGFDLLDGIGFDVEMCIGYPTMRAYVKDYEGTGYYTASAWIQIITKKFFYSSKDSIPTQVVSEADVSDNMQKLGVPFFSFGYPAEIYDAPCNNLGRSASLEWIADTFFVTFPSRINNDTISYLLGFRWGYEESENAGSRKVKILPMEITDNMIWEEHLSLLKENFPNWTFKWFDNGMTTRVISFKPINNFV